MKDLLIGVTGFILVVIISYLLALAGEPQAHWFFCHVLDVCN
jgi:hypothetical protein